MYFYALVNPKGADNVSIGSRLKEERERLGLSQAAFAGLAGASKRAQIDWEKDATSPNAAALSAFADAGADVLYILTGARALRDQAAGPSASLAEAAMDEAEAGFASPAAEYERQLNEFARDSGLPDRTRARADHMLARMGDEAARRRIDQRHRRRDEAFERARRIVREARFVVDWEPPERFEAELVRLVVDFDVDSRQIEDLMRAVRAFAAGDKK